MAQKILVTYATHSAHEAYTAHVLPRPFHRQQSDQHDWEKIRFWANEVLS